MRLRSYQSSDCPELAELFYNTIHAVNARDYTREQVDAWATGQVDLERWDRANELERLSAQDRELREHHTVVAEEGGILVGFGDMDRSGYLDRLFVHRDFQGQGIATAICDALEGGVSMGRLWVQASITARPFFEGRGYRVVKEQQVERRGVLLTNFVMEKIRGT